MPAEERREQLLGVAQEVFARHGYRGTTALEIGREAGVSEKLVLKHFGTKEGLFRAAVVEPLLTLLEAENEHARERLEAGTADTPQEAFGRVHTLLVAWARLVKDRGPLLLSFVAELSEFPDAAERVFALVERQVAQSVEILEQGGHRPEVRPFDPRVAIYAALGAATVAAVVADDPEPFLEEYLKLTLLGVLSDAGRAHLRQQETKA